MDDEAAASSSLRLLLLPLPAGTETSLLSARLVSTSNEWCLRLCGRGSSCLGCMADGFFDICHFLIVLLLGRRHHPVALILNRIAILLFGFPLFLSCLRASSGIVLLRGGVKTSSRMGILFNRSSADRFAICFPSFVSMASVRLLWLRLAWISLFKTLMPGGMRPVAFADALVDGASTDSALALGPNAFGGPEGVAVGDGDISTFHQSSSESVSRGGVCRCLSLLVPPLFRILCRFNGWCLLRRVARARSQHRFKLV